MTASRYDLLPPNATPLEQDFSRSTSSLERAGQPVPVIRTAKRLDIPDSVVPWLVYEYGLGELLPYIESQRQVISDGIPWQRIRGTPQSLLDALDWIGIDGEVDESEGNSARWAEYQIGLSAPVQGLETIYQIMGVAALSQPQRSRLQRIYSVYDYRRFVLDDSLLSEGSPLSDHTGTRPIPDGPQISFGDYRATLIAAPPTLQQCITWVLSAQVPYIDTFLLDHSFIDEDWHIVDGAISRVDVITSSTARLDVRAWATIPWPAEPWDGAGSPVGGIITTVS
jgi:P2-related tail formation protein